MEFGSHNFGFLFVMSFVGLFHAQVYGLFSRNADRGIVTSPNPKPNPQVTCDELTALHNLASSKCSDFPQHKFKAVYFNKEASLWHVDPTGVRVIQKAYIVENKTVILASSLHLFVINSYRSSLIVPFNAPTKQTYIEFPKPFEVPQNNTNLTITVRRNDTGETIDMQTAAIYLYGINATDNCSASNCLDAVSKYLSKVANALKRCKNDSSVLRYRYKICFEPPKITVQPVSQEVKLGANVTLECKAVAPVLQDLKYTWYKDNKPLTGNHGDSIVIPFAQSQDRGSYKCKVSTRYNSVISQVAEIVFTETQATTVLILSVLRNKNKTTDPSPLEVANAVKNYLNNAETNWKFDVKFRQIRGSSATSITMELTVNSVISRDDINSYYSLEQRLIKKGARENAFKGVNLHKREVKMESLEYCLAETTGKNNLKGTFPWPLVAVGHTANVSCPYGPTGAYAQRSCFENFESGATWNAPDDSSCSFQSKTTDGLNNISKKKIDKGNAEEVVKQTKRLTQSVADKKIDTADIVFVADIIDRVLNTAEIGSIGQDLVDIINSVMKANDSVLANGQRSNGTASKFVKLVGSIAENLPIAPGESSRTLVAPNLVIQAAVANVSNFEGRSFSSSASKRRVRDTFSKDSSSGELPADQMQTEILLPSSITEKLHSFPNKEMRMTFALYHNAKFFQTLEDDGNMENKNKSFQNWTINSRVISGSVAGVSLRDLSEPVVTTFKPLEPSKLFPVCAFWNFSLNGGLGNWSNEGCKLVDKSSGRITCHCNHLTNFAVLFTAHGPQSLTKTDEGHNLALSLISYIGCGISLVGVLLTLLTYAMFRTLRKSTSQHILMSLCVALVLLLVVFVVGANRLGGMPGCRTVAALLHYLVLVVMLWMGVEGYHLYLNVVQVLATYQKKFMLKASIIAWGVPAIIVGITLIFATGSYGNSYYCVVTGIPFYGSLFAPALLILTANLIVFFCVMWKLVRQAGDDDSKMQDQNRSSISSRWRTGIAVMLLLGLTWLFGALAIGRAKLVFEYLFCIFNSLQGLSIFIFYCVMRAEVRKKWKDYYHYKRTGDYTLTDMRGTGSTAISTLQRLKWRSSNSETNLIPLKKKAFVEGNGMHNSA